MNKKDERKLQVIESVETKTETKSADKSKRHTSPIVKKFLEFHKENAEKFNVRDLFKR